MSTKQAKATTSTESLTLEALLVDSIQDIKGKKIVLMDMRELDHAPTDRFIICEGESITQVRAISQNISKRVKEEMGILPNHIEGLSECKWILVDYFDIVVHIFYPETREFYDIENLWGDSEMKWIEDLD